MPPGLQSSRRNRDVPIERAIAQFESDSGSNESNRERLDSRCLIKEVLILVNHPLIRDDINTDIASRINDEGGLLNRGVAESGPGNRNGGPLVDLGSSDEVNVNAIARIARCLDGNAAKSI